MASLQDTLKQLILQFVKGTPNATLPRLRQVCVDCFSAAEVAKAVDELEAENKLIISGKFEIVGNERKAIIHLDLP